MFKKVRVYRNTTKAVIGVRIEETNEFVCFQPYETKTDIQGEIKHRWIEDCTREFKDQADKYNKALGKKPKSVDNEEEYKIEE